MAPISFRIQSRPHYGIRGPTRSGLTQSSTLSYCYFLLDALDSLLFLQQGQFVPILGPLHVLFPLPGSFFHSIWVSVPMLFLRRTILDHLYKTVAPSLCLLTLIIFLSGTHLKITLPLPYKNVSSLKSRTWPILF